MSRNSDRIGGPPMQQDNGSPNLTSQQVGTGDFSFVIPTEFVALPSGGKYYPQNNPLYGCDTIEIKQMTAKEEDMLTSRSLLKKGVALERVIDSLIVDKRINPSSILVGDRNAIIVATRIAAYGSDYNTKVTCPSCTAVQEHTFDLNEIGHTETSLNTLEVTLNEDGTFSTTLPRTQLEVTFRLLTGSDEKYLMDGIESDRKTKNRYERTVTRQLTNMLVSVNGNSTAEAIDYTVNNIPSIDARHLREAYRLTNPNLDMSQHFDCKECDYESDMEVPLSADFFWPDA